VRIARLFSGFDGAGEGIRDAGFDLAWAVEKDEKIAAVARMNGHNAITADILDVDPATLERPDGIHASPPCTNASLANSAAEVNEDGTKETRIDRDLAMKTVEFVEVLRPRLFTLENVWQYRNFQAFAGGDKCEGILPALRRLGYRVDYWHLNAADYGVPQTRKRLILVASLDFVPEKPWETHCDTSKPELAHPSLFAPARLPWVGWYEAIEDLIPTLPESKFAPWQVARFPAELQTFLIGSGNTNMADAGQYRQYLAAGDPAPVVASDANITRMRAFLVNSLDATTRPHDEPAQTVMSSDYTLRAFLVHPTDQRTMPVVEQDRPSFTVMSANGNLPMPRAFLVDGDNARVDTGKPTVLEDWQPSMSIRAGRVPPHRAWLSCGKVVKMTPRALARFQSFADDYRLSGNNTLDCKGIGNACAPVLFREIYNQISYQLFM
jgi:DNA-cytosine methyltransferase